MQIFRQLFCIFLKFCILFIKSTLLSALLPLIVRHHLLQVLCVLFGDFWCRSGVVFDLEEFREHLLLGHAFRVSHSVDGCVHYFRHHLKFEQVAAAVAFDDPAHLPEADVVQKLAARDTYLTDKQLIDRLRRCQFFPPFPFSFAASSASSGIRW